MAEALSLFLVESDENIPPDGINVKDRIFVLPQLFNLATILNNINNSNYLSHSSLIYSHGYDVRQFKRLACFVRDYLGLLLPLLVYKKLFDYGFYLAIIR